MNKVIVIRCCMGMQIYARETENVCEKNAELSEFACGEPRAWCVSLSQTFFSPGRASGETYRKASRYTGFYTTQKSGKNAERHTDSRHALSLSLSLSLSCITRVAPHCVNTLMILHAAHY